MAEPLVGMLACMCDAQSSFKTNTMQQHVYNKADVVSFVIAHQYQVCMHDACPIVNIVYVTDILWFYDTRLLCHTVYTFFIVLFIYKTISCDIIKKGHVCGFISCTNIQPINTNA
jgi:hypothetical protein